VGVYGDGGDGGMFLFPHTRRLENRAAAGAWVPCCSFAPHTFLQKMKIKKLLVLYVFIYIRQARPHLTVTFFLCGSRE
jgi:hypothetical protein